MNTWHSIGAEFKVKQYLIDHPEIKHIWIDQVIPLGYDAKFWQENEILHLEPFGSPVVCNDGQFLLQTTTWGRVHVRRFSKRFKKRICCVCRRVMRLKEIFIERTEHNGGFEHYSYSFCFHHGFQHLMRQPVTYQYGGKNHDSND
jgi:hypothetical protein